MTVALIVTLFVAVPTLHYIFFSIIEIACTAFIVWYAWRWPNPEARRVDAIPNAVVRRFGAREIAP